MLNENFVFAVNIFFNRKEMACDTKRITNKARVREIEFTYK